MVKAGCHVGKGLICLDEPNASAPCRRDHTKCGYAQYPDILHVFRSMKLENGSIVYIPSNAIVVNTNKDGATWLEPVVRKGSMEKGNKGQEM